MNEVNCTRPMIRDRDSQLVRAAGKIAVNHVGIPAVDWPAMTMGFSVKPELLEEAAVGNKVEFDVTVNDNGGVARVRARLQRGKPDRPKLLLSQKSVTRRDHAEPFVNITPPSCLDGRVGFDLSRNLICLPLNRLFQDDLWGAGPMGIEVRQLRYAVMTADTQSFSRAAAVLNIKQSTLSRRVLQLEDQLGVKLFERTTRGAEPTDNGRVFIEQARRIVTDIDNLQTTARNVSYGLHGRIAVGYCSSLLSGNLKLAFSDYLTRFPDVQFDGVEAGPEKLLHGLQSRTIDVAVAPIGLGDASLKSRSLWSEKLFVVVTDDNHLVDQERIYWQDLRREVFVVPNSGIGPILGNLISARLTEQAYRPAIIHQDTSLESVLSMVAAKRFITIATEASQGVAWPGLQFREIYDSSGPARLEYALYWREDNQNPALQRFFKLIEERYPG